MFSGSNTDDSFTTAVSNLLVSPLEKSHSCRFWINYGDVLFLLIMVIFFFYIEI